MVYCIDELVLFDQIDIIDVFYSCEIVIKKNKEMVEVVFKFEYNVGYSVFKVIVNVKIFNGKLNILIIMMFGIDIFDCNIFKCLEIDNIKVVVFIWCDVFDVF